MLNKTMGIENNNIILELAMNTENYVDSVIIHSAT
jgi:hypothetical protein